MWLGLAVLVHLLTVPLYRDAFGGWVTLLSLLLVVFGLVFLFVIIIYYIVGRPDGFFAFRPRSFRTGTIFYIHSVAVIKNQKSKQKLTAGWRMYVSYEYLDHGILLL